MDNKVLAGIHYPVEAHRHGTYASRVSLSAAGLETTDSVVDRILSLPIYPELPEADVGRVIDGVNSYLDL